MIRLKANSRLAANLLLALLLFAAQTVALGHQYDHDIGVPQNQVCASCVTASLLASACVDAPSLAATPAKVPVIEHFLLDTPHAVDVPVVRQRGPPVIL